MMDAQELLWRLLDGVGPVVWWIKPALCALAFVILLVRVPPLCWLERIARFVSFLGLLMIMLAVLNSAFGPPGDALFFAGYVLTLVHRRLVEVSRGVVRPKISSRLRRSTIEDELAVLLGAWRDTR